MAGIIDIESRNPIKASGDWVSKLGLFQAICQIHNITTEVPPQNIVAMFDAALEFRNYE